MPQLSEGDRAAFLPAVELRQVSAGDPADCSRLLTLLGISVCIRVHLWLKFLCLYIIITDGAYPLSRHDKAFPGYPRWQDATTGGRTSPGHDADAARMALVGQGEYDGRAGCCSVPPEFHPSPCRPRFAGEGWWRWSTWELSGRAGGHVRDRFIFAPMSLNVMPTEVGIHVFADSNKRRCGSAACARHARYHRRRVIHWGH